MPLEILLGKDLEELGDFCYAVKRFNMQRSETAAINYSLTGVLKKLSSIGLYRSVHVVDLEVFEIGALDEELAKRPVLEGVLVLKCLNLQLLETLLFIDGST